MTDETQEEKKDASLIVLREDGKIDVERVISDDLYGYADQVRPEESLDAFDDNFHKAELARDTSRLRWRVPLLKPNHQNGTFNMEDLGMKDWSPSDLRIQVIDHAPNRALWRITQDKEDPSPLCASLDAITGSVTLPTGERVKCDRCVYGQWWNPIELTNLVNQKGEKSAYAGVMAYINKQLDKHDTSIARLIKEKPDKNIPPPCKESRRIFAFVYDNLKRGGLNQPIVLVIPPTSILAWDKYRQDLSMRKERRKSGDLVPLTLLTTILKVFLNKVTLGSQTFSKFAFEFDKVAAKQMVEFCKMIREGYSKEVMSFEVRMEEFDPTTAEDPMQLLPELPANAPEPELGETMELDDEGDPLDGLKM